MVVCVLKKIVFIVIRSNEETHLFVCLKVFRLLKECLCLHECLIVTQVNTTQVLSCRMYLCRQSFLNYKLMATCLNTCQIAHLPPTSFSVSVSLQTLILVPYPSPALSLSHSLTLSLSLGLPLSCQRHSGLEAD